MAKTVQSQPEPEYGAKVEQERSEEAIAAARPAPEVPLPAPEGTDEQSPFSRGVTVKNPYLLLPSEANFPTNRPKTPPEENYDAALLFEALGRRSQEFKVIADELLGRD